MDDYRPRRSPAGERFIGMFSSPSSPSSSPTENSFVAGDELQEDDFLFSSPAAPPEGPRSPGRGVPRAHLGLLAALALHEGDRRLLVRSGGGGAAAAAASGAGTLLRRKATIAAAAASASAASGASGISGSATSPEQSPSSAARAIPAAAKLKGAAAPAAPPYHQSAPVKVPVRPPRKPSTGRWDEFDDDDDDFRNSDAAMLPPHEMVARASASGAVPAVPAAPFSMLEGAGRTLKGRDLRRVRDAVLRQTGFLD